MSKELSIFKDIKDNLASIWDSFSEADQEIIENILVDVSVCCAGSFVLEQDDFLSEVSHIQLQLQNLNERAQEEIKKAIANAVLKRLRGLAINLAGASLGIPPL